MHIASLCAALLSKFMSLFGGIYEVRLTLINITQKSHLLYNLKHPLLLYCNHFNILPFIFKLKSHIVGLNCPDAIIQM